MIFEIKRATYSAINEIKEPLKLIHTKFSDDFNIHQIEINTLEELMTLMQQVNEELIIRKDGIIIYDDLIE